MKVVSIGDLVVDYYYKNGKLLGINGGMSSHNIVANLSNMGVCTASYGVCGDDPQGMIAIKSLSDVGVDVSGIDVKNEINTRCFHVSYTDTDGKLSFSSKKRCAFCNNKKWYEESMIDKNKIINNLNSDDILIFDNLNKENQYIIDNTKNIKMLDLGQYYELDNYTDNEVVSKLNSHFDIINLNERVEKYLLKRFKLKNLTDILSLLNSKLVIVTRGKKGADFVFDNILYHKTLDVISEETDSTGAGDAFFSVFIKEYIDNNFAISKEFIDDTFKKAVRLTNKVVKKMGARGHINNLYKIKKKDDYCTCLNFDLVVRKKIKRCNININNLEKRVLNAVNSKAYDELKQVDFKDLDNCLFIGTGGSFSAAYFASRVINNLYGINAFPLLPRDVKYRNNSKVQKIILFSYSGTTKDLITATEDILSDKKIIVTKSQKQKVVMKTGINKSNIISYQSASNKSKERGFLAFEGVLSPASLFFRLYIEKSNLNLNISNFISDALEYWKEYFKKYFKENKDKLKKMLVFKNILNIFYGDYTNSCAFDLESKIIESGIFNAILHEKKNFSHGRFINYENLNNKFNIYFKEKEISMYEKSLLDYLHNDTTIIIESRYNGILCEFDLLVASQYLIYYISNFLDIDASKPKYSDAAMKIYFYNGEL